MFAFRVICLGLLDFFKNCLSFCSNLSYCLFVWSDYEIIFFVVFVLELRNITVCLFPKLSKDIRFRMMDAKLGLVIFNVLNC